MKTLNKVLTHLEKTKKMYLFLFLLVIIGVIFGSVFFNLISTNDKLLVSNKLTTFFSNIDNNTINSFEVFKNTYIINLLIITIIWILGISIIGIIINTFIVYLKGFILGFIISSLIYQYKLVGIIGVLTYIFPHYFINLLIIILLTYFSYNMSKIVIKGVIKKENINFSRFMSSYYKIYIFAFITITLTSLFEAFISKYLIKLFIMLI